jgi:hypothetical protein
MAQIRALAYSRFLAIQKLHRLTCSHIFEVAFSKATESNKLSIKDLIQSSSLENLRDLIYKLGTESLEDKPIMEWRKIGKKYEITRSCAQCRQ